MNNKTSSRECFTPFTLIFGQLMVKDKNAYMILQRRVLTLYTRKESLGFKKFLCVKSTVFHGETNSFMQRNFLKLQSPCKHRCLSCKNAVSIACVLTCQMTGEI